jgi:hypothetical protein
MQIIAINAKIGVDQRENNYTFAPLFKEAEEI